MQYSSKVVQMRYAAASTRGGLSRGSREVGEERKRLAAGPATSSRPADASRPVPFKGGEPDYAQPSPLMPGLAKATPPSTVTVEPTT
jgi:hypothetical protein